METSFAAEIRPTSVSQAPLSVRQAFFGRHILVVGASGFLGKVWLSMALDQLPDIGRVFVLMRRRGTKSPRQRFEEMVSSSYVFQPLHEKHGPKLSAYLSARVEIVEGDVSKPNLGLSPETIRRLSGDLDLVINCAGLVDFNPDIRDALSVNIDGALNCIKFAEGCSHVSLLHVSTCYVAGIRQGRISETFDPLKAPSGKAFDVEEELASLRQAVDRILADPSTPEEDGKSRAIPAAVRRRQVREAMVAEGTRRAKRWGWQNTYTYTKSIAEALLARRQTPIRWAAFRPAIVESAISFPFPGWNEGFNTCGPITYLLGTWFRYFPAKVGNPFDIVPVDMVCKGMTAVGAALLNGRNRTIYQCGTSDANLLTIDRAARLASLSHRIHYRKEGKTIVERMIRSRWRTVTVADNHPFSIKSLRTVFRDLNQLLNEISKSPRAPRPIRIASRHFSKFSQRTDRKLAKINRMLDLFAPFIHDHHHVFETRNLRELNVTEAEFRFQPETIDWREYWLKIHMPGLRRWSFPLIEGKPVETFTPETTVRMKAPETASPREATA